jgi:UDP-N-acetylmuramyl pentapeptide phosphotransferase/UDP-N-acetylglucosamine-1-phosphate transferase
LLTDGLDSLAPVPLAMLAVLIGLVPLWWAVRWLVALFHG